MAGEKQESFQRFEVIQRLEHALLVLAFIGLALTGLPQKFALQGWGRAMISLMGGIESVRVIHRAMATLLMAIAIWHLVSSAYKLFVLRLRSYMLPRLEDALDLLRQVGYNLGIRRERPRMDRFNFEEKLEYWALVWGTLIMIITGFMLWNPIATTRFLPGLVIPAAKAAHGGEALLAAWAILTWHMYSVHLRHFNPSMFTGKLDRRAMAEEHSLELERIESGRVPSAPPAHVRRKRLRRFVPVMVVVTALLVAGLVWFVRFEQTAISTIPPYEIEVVPPELQQ